MEDESMKEWCLLRMAFFACAFQKVTAKDEF